jgi:hypothetical protein
MVRRQVRAKVTLFEVHKPERHRIPAITIHHNKGRLGQQSDSVNSTHESRTTPPPTTDVEGTSIDAAVAEDAYDIELPGNDSAVELTTKVRCIPPISTLY